MQEFYAASRWSKPCIDMFWTLAEAQDYTLLNIVRDPELCPTDLTYAAQAAGLLTDASRSA